MDKIREAAVRKRLAGAGPFRGPKKSWTETPSLEAVVVSEAGTDSVMVLSASTVLPPPEVPPLVEQIDGDDIMITEPPPTRTTPTTSRVPSPSQVPSTPEWMAAPVFQSSTQECGKAPIKDALEDFMEYYDIRIPTGESAV